MCRAEFLNYLRVREWQDIYSQLRRSQASADTERGNQPAEPLKVHLSLLAGLLSHIGLKDAEKNEYLGARGARFAIFPGSALFKKPPRWVMAAELVETSRLWGAGRGADRAGVGRAAGPAPRQAHLQRAALGEEGRRP